MSIIEEKKNIIESLGDIQSVSDTNLCKAIRSLLSGISLTNQVEPMGSVESTLQVLIPLSSFSKTKGFSKNDRDVIDSIIFKRFLTRVQTFHQ